MLQGVKDASLHRALALAVIARVLVEDRRIKKNAEEIAGRVVGHGSGKALGIAVGALSKGSIVPVGLGLGGIPGRTHKIDRIDLLVYEQPEFLPGIHGARP